MKTYSPAGQDTIGYYDALAAVWKLENNERENYRKYMELNPGDNQRKSDHIIAMATLHAVEMELNEIRRNNKR